MDLHVLLILQCYAIDFYIFILFLLINKLQVFVITFPGCWRVKSFNILNIAFEFASNNNNNTKILSKSFMKQVFISNKTKIMTNFADGT